MLTIVAIRMEERHWTITDMRSEIMILTLEVSLIIREVSEPTVFSGFSNHANSLSRTPAKTGLICILMA